MKYARLALAVILFAAVGAGAACAEDYVITLKDHAFQPAELKIPAGQKVKILVKNKGDTPAEFESYQLNREKIIGAGKDGVVFIGPLKPGAYEYFDDFHQGTTGKIKAE